MKIQIRNLGKSFGKSAVLHDISCDISSGEFLTLLGPSGCGKTTLLRILAGLESLDQGSIYFDDTVAARWSLQERRVGFVFQHYALFPHMNVYENVAFGPKMQARSKALSKSELKHKVTELLALVRLEHLAKRYPHQLSGGQRQRVALARALAIEPRVLLLDEPFGALDAHVREDLRNELRSLQQKLGMTCLLVTHDQDEAMALSDRIMLLNQGRVEQIGTPDQLYQQPKSTYVMGYLGGANAIPADALGLPESGKVYIRAHDIRLAEPGKQRFLARIRSLSPHGSLIQAGLELPWLEGFGVLKVEIPRERWHAQSFRPGELVSWDFLSYKYFDHLVSDA